MEGWHAGCVVSTPNKSNPTCVGRDMAKTLCYRSFHGDVPDGQVAKLTRIGVLQLADVPLFFFR